MRKSSNVSYLSRHVPMVRFFLIIKNALVFPLRALPALAQILVTRQRGGEQLRADAHPMSSLKLWPRQIHHLKTKTARYQPPLAPCKFFISETSRYTSFKCQYLFIHINSNLLTCVYIRPAMLLGRHSREWHRCSKVIMRCCLNLSWAWQSVYGKME